MSKLMRRDVVADTVDSSIERKVYFLSNIFISLIANNYLLIMFSFEFAYSDKGLMR